MKIKEAVRALELFAPLPLQESYDNAGLQIGLTERELSGALLCLDVTEETVAEAVAKGCNLIVAHHPLLFRGLKCVSDADYVQRTVRAAIRADVAIYAAHTNLDNARGGVNFRAAEMLGLQGADFLRPLPGVEGGSGVVGDLPEAVGTEAFLNIIRSAFGVERIEANLAQPAAIRRVAFCGGAGDFLIDDAVRAGADAFVTGEVGYTTSSATTTNCLSAPWATTTASGTPPPCCVTSCAPPVPVSPCYLPKGAGRQETSEPPPFQANKQQNQ